MSELSEWEEDVTDFWDQTRKMVGTCQGFWNRKGERCTARATVEHDGTAYCAKHVPVLQQAQKDI